MLICSLIQRSSFWADSRSRHAKMSCDKFGDFCPACRISLGESRGITWSVESGGCWEVKFGWAMFCRTGELVYPSYTHLRHNSETSMPLKIQCSLHPITHEFCTTAREPLIFWILTSCWIYSCFKFPPPAFLFLFGFERWGAQSVTLPLISKRRDTACEDERARSVS